MTESFPLKWPLGKPTTNKWQRKNATFKCTMGRSRDELLHELKLLGAKSVVISSNVATYVRGGQTIMYADQSAAKDNPGVAVYYEWKGESYSLCCDRYSTVADNLQALNKTVNAIRGIERWGTGEMMKAAFAGFKEIPAPPVDCWGLLGIKLTKDKDFIHATYRELAKKMHPDVGGTAEAFCQLQDARDRAIQFANQ